MTATHLRHLFIELAPVRKMGQRGQQRLLHPLDTILHVTFFIAFGNITKTRLEQMVSRIEGVEMSKIEMEQRVGHALWDGKLAMDELETEGAEMAAERRTALVRIVEIARGVAFWLRDEGGDVAIGHPLSTLGDPVDTPEHQEAGSARLINPAAWN